MDVAVVQVVFPFTFSTDMQFGNAGITALSKFCVYGTFTAPHGVKKVTDVVQVLVAVGETHEPRRYTLYVVAADSPVKAIGEPATLPLCTRPVAPLPAAPLVRIS